jgi:lysophospholipase L1-like esterase
MRKIVFIFLWVLLASCICGGGSPQTNNQIPSISYKVTMVRNDTLYTYGDSFTAGFNATPNDSCYAKRLATYYSDVLVNRGVGGSTVNAAYTSFKTDKLSGKDKPVTMMSGVNDFRGGTHQHPILTLQCMGYFKSAITLQFLKSYVFATSTSVIKSGTWDSSTTDLVTGLHSKYLTSSTANSTATYIFTDSTLVIGTFGSNGYGVVSGHFEVTIDGIFKGRYFFGAYGLAGYTPQTLVFRGLSNASHTVVVTKIGTNKIALDYFGHLKNSSDCKPIIIGEVPNWNKADFTSYMGTNFYEYINTQICNIKSDYYGYPVIIAPVNTYLNPNLDIDTDNVHPTNQGHRHIFESFLSVTQ